MTETKEVNWRELAIHEGVSMATMVFTDRRTPKHSTIIIGLDDLATLLSAAWELGNDFGRKAKS